MQTADAMHGTEPGALAPPVPRRGWEWASVAVLGLLAVVCCAPLLDAGWFASHEQLRPIAWTLAAYREIADGDLYPRWISTGYLGKGVPLFNFYPPAFSLLVAYAHALGVPLLLAAKLILFLLFFAGAVGVYLWVRRHVGDLPALLAGILYLFAPYHFVDLYVRGATAEFTSLAVLPFLFLGMDMVLERRSVRGLATVALASAGIVLSHFLGALMIAPFAAVYALARGRRFGGWPALGRIAAGGAVGAALSAFYWLPALVERDALSTERMQRTFSGYYSFLLHFVEPAQWLAPGWGFGGSAPGADDGMSFQVGLLTVATIAATLVLLPRLARPARGFTVLVLALGLGALGLTSAASRPLYVWLEPLQLVQFPWRFLGPATLFLAAAGAGFARVAAERAPRLARGLAAGAAALAIVISVPQRAVEHPVGVSDDPGAIEAVIAGDGFSGTFGNEDEYLPRDASVEAAHMRPGGPDPIGLGVEIGAVRAERNEVSFEVTSPVAGGIAIVPCHAFPGWEVSLDGRAWELEPGPYGLIALRVPQGRHVARVRFGTTAPRVAGWLLALAGLVALGALALRERALSRAAPARG